MSINREKHIAFTLQGQTYFVPTHFTIRRQDDLTKVTFEFDSNAAPLDVKYITVYRDFNEVIMITERGNEFNSGPLYDQLLLWFDEILPNEHQTS